MKVATPQCISKYVRILSEAFRQSPTVDTFAAYEFGLLDLSDQQVINAIAKAVRSCKFMPSVAELRQLSGELRETDRATLAWGVVEGKIHLGPYKHVDFDDGLINATIRNMGGWVTFLDQFKDAESEKWHRKTFIDTYQRLMASGVTGEMCRPLPGLNECSVVGGVVGPPIVLRIETGLPMIGGPAEVLPKIETPVAPLLTLRKAE